MCLILLAYEAHPAYPLILAANRDEFYGRPTKRAAFWPDAPGVLAGRDLEGGGTWLGVTKRGRVAAVTNFRDPRSVKSDAPSRGLLVGDFLRGTETPDEYLSALAARGRQYNGFNLIFGDARRLYYFSNRAPEPQTLAPGLYGLSNHLLNTAWPKVNKGLKALSELVARGETLSTNSLFDVLADRTRATDELLPETGVGVEAERMLSPLFIHSPDYGTRSSTVLLFDRAGNVAFVERGHDPHAGAQEDVSYQFKIE